MTRAELHKLLDEVPDARVDSVGVVLRRVLDDPEVVTLLGILWDDEPYTDEERAQDAEALARIETGEGIEWEEAKRGLRAAG
ncbi:MAG TPA: hypothetical protein VG015_03315 [Candidatus Dormibacteraeota bacterium]|nr:hypothetical protein [Candidatus Dormibacteraeota bacterium]